MSILFQASVYSLQGLAAALRYEQAFRQEVVLAFILIPLGIYLGETMTDKILLSGSWLVVMIVELLNSAIETIVDLVSPDHNPLAGRAKDMGSAAVFLALVLWGFVWCIILANRFNLTNYL